MKTNAFSQFMTRALAKPPRRRGGRAPAKSNLYVHYPHGIVRKTTLKRWSDAAQISVRLPLKPKRKLPPNARKTRRNRVRGYRALIRVLTFASLVIQKEAE